MALRAASTVEVEGQDYIDFKELAKGNTAVLFSVREIEESTDLGNGPLEPVRARVVILSGPLAGEVRENERILAAGIRNRLTEVGLDVVGRLRPYGARKAAGLENEEDGDVELAEAWLAHLDADGPRPGAAASAGKTGPAKVGAKAKAAAKPAPVEDESADEDDEEPPF